MDPTEDYTLNIEAIAEEKVGKGHSAGWHAARRLWVEAVDAADREDPAISGMCHR